MTGQATLLLCGLFLAHYVGDFTPLVSRRMLEAKAAADPLWPIAVHAGVHTALVAAVIVLVAFPAWPLLLLGCALEFITHFVIDTSRAKLGRRYPVLNDPGRARFWHFLGIDQFLHAIVLILLAAIVLR
jgi:hypothetical protein